MRFRSWELEEKEELLARIESALADAERKVRTPPPNYALSPQQAIEWRDYCAGAAAQVRAEIAKLKRLH